MAGATPNHSARAHASLGASSAYRWIACPGSIGLSANVAPGESSVYAKEGTAAHELAQMCLMEGRDAVEYIDRVIDDFTVDEEMAEAVQVYLDAVRGAQTNASMLLVEKKFKLDKLLGGTALEGLMYGTNDACVLVPDNSKSSKLYVFDYKHGRGVAVDVIGNPQLRYYGLGASLELAHHAITEIEIVIVQPRARHKDGPVRREVITPYELVEWSADLVDAAERTLAPGAPLVAGDHCGWCPAAGICPEVRNKSLAAAQMQFVPIADEAGIVVPPPPETMTPEQIGRVLDMAEVVGDWVAAVKAHAHLQLDHGVKIPGWKLVPKRATRKWKHDDDTIASSLDILGLDVENIYKDPQVRSPAQIEKLLPKSEREALADLVVKESSGTTIARDSDDRKAIANKATADFQPL